MKEQQEASGLVSRAGQAEGDVMRIAGKLFTGAAVLLLCCACWFVTQAGAQEHENAQGVILIGSDTLVPLARRLAEEWMRLHPQAVVSVNGGGSERGIKAVQDSAAHIGLVSSPTEAVVAARRKGIPPLVIHRIARDAVIPVTHPSNPVRDLSLAQLRGVFAGDIRNWNELGGPDAQIDVLTHGGESGTYAAWKERVMGEKRVVLPSARVMGTGAMLRELAGNPNAIGYVAYAEPIGEVQALSVGSIAATVENISSETFPIVRSLKFVTFSELDENTRRFLDFCFDPAQGTRIQKDLGMIPHMRTSALDGARKP